MLYLVNAFSINMLTDLLEQGPLSVHIVPVDSKYVSNLLADRDFTSAVGHADTARIISNILGIDVPVNRVNVSLRWGDAIIVAQYTGPRLSEGATELPEGAQIRFFMVYI